MTRSVLRTLRSALACAALTIALWLPWASSAPAQQPAPQIEAQIAQQPSQRRGFSASSKRATSRQIAANDAPSGTMTPGADPQEPGATLGVPGSAVGGPGAGMGPKSEGPEAAGAPGAALAPKDAAAMPGTGMGRAPTQAEINEQLLYDHQPPTRVRIAIVNATGEPNGAAKVAVLLSEYRRRPLEDRMGLQIDVVNISTGYERTQAPAVVYYRPGFLRAALLLAQSIPGDTMVSAMRPQALKRAGMDVEVVVGEALP